MSALEVVPADETPAGRDYRKAMNDLLALKTPDSEYVPAVVAVEIAAYLDKHDRDLRDGWLAVNLVPLLTDVIGIRARNARAKATREAPAAAFAEAAAKFESGLDPEAMSAFRATYVVNDDNLRRAVADMTAEDHLYVAAGYTHTANAAAFEAAFHKAIAKKVAALGPGKTTAEVMDEATYMRLRDSLPG